MNYDKIYTLKTHNMFTAGGRRITSVLTGLERLRGKS